MAFGFSMFSVIFRSLLLGLDISHGSTPIGISMEVHGRKIGLTFSSIDRTKI